MNHEHVGGTTAMNGKRKPGHPGLARLACP